MPTHQAAMKSSCQLSGSAERQLLRADTANAGASAGDGGERLGGVTTDGTAMPAAGPELLELLPPPPPLTTAWFAAVLPSVSTTVSNFIELLPPTACAPIDEGTAADAEVCRRRITGLTPRLHCNGVCADDRLTDVCPAATCKPPGVCKLCGDCMIATLLLFLAGVNIRGCGCGTGCCC